MALLIVLFSPTSRPFAPIEYRHEQRREPDLSIHIATIDLTDPSVEVHVAPAGTDPDGDGEWQTTLAPVRETARRARFDLAINGSFFEIKRPTTFPTTPPTTATTNHAEYVSGIWAKSVGWHMSDGRLDSPARRDGWPIVWIEGERRMRIGSPELLPRDARQIVSGSNYVLRDGKPADSSSKLMSTRHPRTAIGIDRDGAKLFILTVDGRRPGVSVGMTGAELAAEFAKLGANDAINLDGGGSTTLVMRDAATDALSVINQPSDGRERNVADAIGITIRTK